MGSSCEKWSDVTRWTARHTGGRFEPLARWHDTSPPQGFALAVDAAHLPYIPGDPVTGGHMNRRETPRFIRVHTYRSSTESGIFDLPSYCTGTTS